MSELAPAAPSSVRQEEGGVFGLDYGRLIVDAWNLMKGRPFLWVLGIVATAGGAVWSLIWRWWSLAYWRPNQIGPAEMLEQLSGLFNRPGLLIGGVLLLFVGFLLFWLVSTVADGGLIAGVGRLNKGGVVSGREAWSVGVGLLGRLVALDTVLFFPLFILLLVQMVGGTAVWVWFVLSLAGGKTAEEVLTPFLGLSFCFALSGLLIIPVTVATMVFRQLAFRAAVLQGLGVRPAIDFTKGLIRRHWGHVLILTMLIWVVQYFLGLVFGIVLMPLLLVDMVPLFLSLSGREVPALLPVVIGVGLLSGLLTAVFSGVVRTYTSALWTLAYERMREEERTRSVERGVWSVE